MKCKEGCKDYRPGCFCTCRKPDGGNEIYANYLRDLIERRRLAGSRPEPPGMRKVAQGAGK